MSCGLTVNFISNFYAMVVCFVIFLSSAICSNMIMAVAVNLYPTNYRGMATSFIMVFGRIGSVSGSSIIGFLVGNHCTLIFYLYGGILISKCIERTIDYFITLCPDSFFAWLSHFLH